jgi:acetylornithine deacetylase
MDHSKDVASPVPVSQEVRDWLTTLIGFDTTSHRSNLALIDCVRDYLAGYAVSSQLFFNTDKTKANLYATIGPAERGGYVLSGHTDVVPVTGQDWHYDPWEATQENGRVHGRGACDMKGFIAAALARVPQMVNADLSRPIHLCLSYDEEIGCVGVRSLLAFLSETTVKPVGCIVGEPTGMRVVSGHKGKLSIRCRVKGHACHSSLAPRGVNAVEAAARIVTCLSDMAGRTQREGPFDYAFDIPHTTIHTGVIRGGSALNIVPSDCVFEFEVRHLPSDDPVAYFQEVEAFALQQLQPAMRAEVRETGFEFEEQSRFPGLDQDPEAEIVALVKRLTEDPEVGKVAFGTEGGGFDAIGIPAVVCGPGHIDQAHKPDEFVTLEQLGLCERFIVRLIEDLSD